MVILGILMQWNDFRDVQGSLGSERNDSDPPCRLTMSLQLNASI